MCRTSQVLYVWCQCEEAHILEPCHAGQLSSSSRNSSCDSVNSSEPVYLHCFCHYHSTNGFTSIKKDQKSQRKADKKKNKRRSMDSVNSLESLTSNTSSMASSSPSSSVLEKSPSRFRRSIFSLRRLSFA